MIKKRFIILILISPVLKSQDNLSTKSHKFNLSFQAVLTANNGVSNLSSNELKLSSPGPDYNFSNATFSKVKGSPLCFGFSGGLELNAGKNPRIRHLMGLTYDYTNSYYNYKADVQWHYLGLANQDLKYNIDFQRSVQFVGINYGALFSITPHFSAALFASFSQVLKAEETGKGYYTQPGASSGMDSVPFVSSAKIKNGVSNLLSLRLRLGYKLPFRKQLLDVFVQRNLFSFSVLSDVTGYYLAPWWNIGINIRLK